MIIQNFFLINCGFLFLYFWGTYVNWYLSMNIICIVDLTLVVQLSLYTYNFSWISRTARHYTFASNYRISVAGLEDPYCSFVDEKVEGLCTVGVREVTFDHLEKYSQNNWVSVNISTVSLTNSYLYFQVRLDNHRPSPGVVVSVFLFCFAYSHLIYPCYFYWILPCSGLVWGEHDGTIKG